MSVKPPEVGGIRGGKKGKVCPWKYDSGYGERGDCMQEKKGIKIIIPEGRFEGYCEGCFHGKRNDKDAEGRILCKGEPGGYKVPYEKNNCQHYAPRVTTWIKIIAVSYLALTGLVVFFELLLG